MTIISDASEFTQFSTKYEKYLDYFLFQEYIPGMADQMYTVGIYANKEHKVLGLFTGRKVRGFPPDIGDCIVGQNEQMPPEITECVKQMVKDLKYTGMAEFEFKKILQRENSDSSRLTPEAGRGSVSHRPSVSVSPG